MTDCAQLIVQGGGGFLMEKSRILDRHFLRATGKQNPRVCFLGTASGDAESARYKFYEAMATLDCRPTHLSLVQPPTADLAAFVLEQDAIYVGGGNTRSLLALWREWGLDGALRAAYERGVVLGGISAGMICWFEYGITDSVPGPLSPLQCLGWLPGIRLPALRRRSGAPPGVSSLADGGSDSAGLRRRRRRRAAFRRREPRRSRGRQGRRRRVSRRARGRHGGRDCAARPQPDVDYPRVPATHRIARRQVQRRGMARARRPRGVLPAGRALRHGRHDGQPHLVARPRRARRLPDQSLRHALRGDHRVVPCQGRS